MGLAVMDFFHHGLEAIMSFFALSARRLTGQPADEAIDDQILWDDGEPEERS